MVAIAFDDAKSLANFPHQKKQRNPLNICKICTDNRILYFQWVKLWRFGTTRRQIPTIGS
jgi:hypothetical protein